MEIRDYLKLYYETHDEDTRLTTRTGRLEFLTTMRYLERYLKPGMRILEIGAATGRYSHTLARMGYQVDALELIDHNIEIFHHERYDGHGYLYNAERDMIPLEARIIAVCDSIDARLRPAPTAELCHWRFAATRSRKYRADV